MQDTFKLLADFLERVGDDVQGRATEQPPDELMAQLRAFAEGTLPPAERSELAALLKQHPQWVSILAGEAKALRPVQSSAD